MLTHQRRALFGSGRKLLFLLMALFVCAGLSADTRAQSGTFATQLILRDDSTSYNLTPYMYVTRDPAKVMTYSGLTERHLNGKRGDVLDGSVLPLGSTGVPHWVIATINNQSHNERWVLNLGDHLDGRIGLIDRIFIYDNMTRRRVIDTVSLNPVPGTKAEVFNGTTIKVNIASGASAMLVMYIVPRAGIPLTLGFDFMTEDRYVQDSTNPLRGTNIIYLLFALTIGFHLATMVLMRAAGNVTIIAYFVAQLLLFSWTNDGVYSPLAHAQMITATLTTLALVTGFAMMKSFFNINTYDGTPFKVIVGAPLLIIAMALASGMMLPADNLIRHGLLGAAVIGGYLLLILLSLAQMFQGKSGALYMALGWGCVFLGAFTTLLASANVIAPSVATASAYWYALVPQMALTGMVVVIHYLRLEMLRTQEEEEFEEEDRQVSKIVQSREGQEFNRLKRLVEHEREVMQELRDREVQQNEEMRQARVAADEANRAKSAFLAVVSHEIRTPMTGIMGMVRLLLETAMSASQKDYAQTIQDSGDAMMALLNDILDFEKIESGKMDLEMIDFDLHRLANSIITLMSGHANNKNIYLRLHLDPAVPRYVIGDPVRLRQVLLNLVGNSIKFTKEGGVTLDLSPEPNSEGLARGKVYKIRFSVRDTGVGISKEAQHNLFRPFAQADSSVSRKFGGTGLGLAISQRLIETMGNRIAIDSEEGRGSTFHFTLIMEEGQAVDSGSTDVVRDSLSSKSEKALRILVVEDNEINQKLLKEFIGRMGHEVIQAFSGEDGIEAVKRERPDMIFMDVEMPGISGMGATKAIRNLADDQLARVPVIALTGNTREEDIRTCYAANMNGHLAKPVDPLRLRQMIDKVINNKLDNPVEISEDRGEAYTQTTQLASAVVEPAPAPKPAASVPSQGDSAVLRQLMQENSNDIINDEPLGKTKPAAAPERSFLSELVASEGTTLQLDDELDEDTFEQAVMAAEDIKAKKISVDIVFDKAMLEPLKGGMKPDQLQELITGLLDKAEEIVLALDVAANTQDRTSITARAHELKGMAGNFGLIELSKVAEVLERVSKHEPATDLSGLIASVPDAYKRARSEITIWLAQ